MYEGLQIYNGGLTQPAQLNIQYEWRIEDAHGNITGLGPIAGPGPVG